MLGGQRDGTPFGNNGNSLVENNLLTSVLQLKWINAIDVENKTMGILS